MFNNIIDLDWTKISTLSLRLPVTKIQIYRVSLTHEIQVAVYFLYLKCEPKTIIRKERRNLLKGEKTTTTTTTTRDGVTFFRKDRNHIDISQIPVMLCCTVGCIRGEQLLSAVTILTVVYVSNSTVCISQPLSHSHDSVKDCKAQSCSI